MPRRRPHALRLGSLGAALTIACSLLSPATARAQQAETKKPARCLPQPGTQVVPVEPQGPEPDGLLPHLDSLKLELAALIGVQTYSGVRDWKWGTAHWRLVSEGWFGMDTGSGGMDKLGHLYTNYLQTEFLYLRLRTYHGENASVTLWPPIFVWTIMLYVEFFDAFSVDHGFSPEDVTMNTLGAGFAYLRAKVPATRVIDYRLEYYPSSNEKGFHPMLDYSGQKFLLAFRPGKLPVLEPTALRAAEFYFGYSARGFEEKGGLRTADVFVGMGIDLRGVFEMALGPPKPGGFYDHVATGFSVFQLPYPYPSQVLHTRQALPPSR